jgi:fimbrial chaperone protein
MTESITIRNGENAVLSMQLRAYGWSQDEQGRDVYEPTDELIFFPKLLTLAPGEKRMVRVGVRGAPPEGELGYRIYLEELPETKSASPGGLRTLLRVGLPVFRQPAKVEQVGEVADLELERCQARFRVANRGNAHLRLNKVGIEAFGPNGQRLATGEMKGWYVLAGNERPYTYEFPDEVCEETRRLEVRVEAEHGSFEGAMDGPS